MVLHILLLRSVVTHHYFCLSAARMHQGIIPLLALALVSLGANVQVPLGDTHREQANFAQIQPQMFMGSEFNEFRDTCTTLRGHLTQEEIDVCDYFSEEEDPYSPNYGIFQVDFVAHICGYKAKSVSIPYTVSNDSSMFAFSVPQLGPGILYDRFAAESFKSFGIMGKWQEIQRTLYCLREQNNMTKNIEYVIDNLYSQPFDILTSVE
jgi:hypothetical protein